MPLATLAFQWQVDVGNHLVVFDFRADVHVMENDREIAERFAALRQPLTIEIDRREIVRARSAMLGQRTAIPRKVPVERFARRGYTLGKASASVSPGGSARHFANSSSRTDRMWLSESSVIRKDGTGALAFSKNV